MGARPLCPVLSVVVVNGPTTLPNATTAAVVAGSGRTNSATSDDSIEPGCLGERTVFSVGSHAVV